VTVPFFRRGTSRVFVVPTIADADLNPTALEVTAGDEISDLIAGMDGFNFQNSPIGTPRLSTTFTTSIPGEDTADNPQLTFYELLSGNTLFATLAKGTVTHLVIFYAGTAGANPAAADKAEVWKVISTGPSREYSMDNVAAKWQARMTPDREPAFEATLT
jgi:hypothetical protein